MKLYFSVASPYSRLMRIIIRQFNIAVDELEINPFDNDSDFLQVNPLAKVPCLVLPNQQALFDSEVIARYLDQEFAHSRLFTAEPYWSQQQFFALLKGCLDIAVQLRQEQMRLN
ncbi:glutathione S-transferase N-terminal domain-containing protein [Shewanella marina]|uniref:glutathione S-transferase N-terminal domain-containing protein n=1 Tax=Shewanella marina TaxID=487319 RepID=UPI000684DD94|nr:glutathione S-transferase N-terminal domain-containing protein [Shewanella marina]